MINSGVLESKVLPNLLVDQGFSCFNRIFFQAHPTDDIQISHYSLVESLFMDGQSQSLVLLLEPPFTYTDFYQVADSKVCMDVGLDFFNPTRWGPLVMSWSMTP